MFSTSSLSLSPASESSSSPSAVPGQLTIKGECLSIDEKKITLLQSATCPKHGQKPFNNLDSKETEKAKLVPAKSKLPDTKEILKILRERAIFIVSILVISVWLATLRQTEGHSVTVSCLLGPGLQNTLPVYFHPAQHRLLADLQ